MAVLSTALMCVALTVYHEAKGESTQGQMAVARVVHNRAGGDPNQYCKVVHEKGQFVWVSRGLKANTNSKEWKNCVDAAKEFLDFPDWSNGALYFDVLRNRPKWKKYKIVAQIGGHHFYRKA